MKQILPYFGPLSLFFFQTEESGTQKPPPNFLLQGKSHLQKIVQFPANESKDRIPSPEKKAKVESFKKECGILKALGYRLKPETLVCGDFGILRLWHPTYYERLIGLDPKTLKPSIMGPEGTLAPFEYYETPFEVLNNKHKKFISPFLFLDGFEVKVPFLEIAFEDLGENKGVLVIYNWLRIEDPIVYQIEIQKDKPGDIDVILTEIQEVIRKIASNLDIAQGLLNRIPLDQGLNLPWHYTFDIMPKVTLSDGQKEIFDRIFKYSPGVEDAYEPKFKIRIYPDGIPIDPENEDPIIVEISKEIMEQLGYVSFRINGRLSQISLSILRPKPLFVFRRGNWVFPDYRIFLDESHLDEQNLSQVEMDFHPHPILSDLTSQNLEARPIEVDISVAGIEDIPNLNGFFYLRRDTFVGNFGSEGQYRLDSAYNKEETKVILEPRIPWENIEETEGFLGNSPGEIIQGVYVYSGIASIASVSPEFPNRINIGLEGLTNPDRVGPTHNIIRHETMHAADYYWGFNQVQIKEEFLEKEGISFRNLKELYKYFLEFGDRFMVPISEPTFYSYNVGLRHHQESLFELTAALIHSLMHTHWQERVEKLDQNYEGFKTNYLLALKTLRACVNSIEKFPPNAPIRATLDEKISLLQDG